MRDDESGREAIRHGKSESGAGASGPRSGTGRLALKVVAAFLLLTIPLGWAVFREHAAFHEYVRTTLDEPATPPPWRSGNYDGEACVGAGLDWLAACQGYEEFCRRAMPRVIEECLAAGDRTVFCSDHRDELLRTTFGYEQCAERVAGGQVSDDRFGRQSCALAYRTAAEWCIEHTGVAPAPEQ